MSVDYNAIISFGAEVILTKGKNIDDVKEWLAANESLELSIVEYGSMSYGGSGGHIVGDTYCTGSSGARPAVLKSYVFVKPDDVLRRLTAAVEAGAPFIIAGNVAWHYGVLVY